jgi:membrane-bound lytic murein transglycosylase F
MKRRFAIIPALLLMVLVAAYINQPSFHIFQTSFVHNRTEASTPERPDVPPEPPPPIVRDLDQIRTRDTLTALVVSNSTSYFVYRGEPMGFELDLLKAFAKADSLVLKVRVVRDMDELNTRLNRGEGDIVAARLVPTHLDAERMRLTRPLYRSRPVLVQRSSRPELTGAHVPHDVDSMIARSAGAREAAAARQETEYAEIRRPADLVQDTVYLQKPSAYYTTLVELADSLTGDITVVQAPRTAAEGLMNRVAEGDIDYTVTEENLAKLSTTTRDNLAATPVMGPPRDIVWAVRKNAPQLQARLDQWLESQQAGDAYHALYRKYFVDRKGYGERVSSRYLMSETHVLSQYDDLFREGARTLGWDWRLLASQAYQESRFDPKARSWAGATGLLQLMPATARAHGVRNANDPRENVAGAVDFTQWLINFWKTRLDASPKERLKFILASYNAGPGHVEDARRLAVKHGDDPNRWDDVAYWLLQKSKREVYSDPVVRHGFCRGLEPVTYVAIILDRYDHYRQFVDDPPSG